MRSRPLRVPGDARPGYDAKGTSRAEDAFGKASLSGLPASGFRRCARRANAKGGLWRGPPLRGKVMACRIGPIMREKSQSASLMRIERVFACGIDIIDARLESLKGNPIQRLSSPSWTIRERRIWENAAIYVGSRSSGLMW